MSLLALAALGVGACSGSGRQEEVEADEPELTDLLRVEEIEVGERSAAARLR